MGKADRSFARSMRLLSQMQDQLVMRVLVQVRQELDARVEAEVKRIFESQEEVPAEQHGEVLPSLCHIAPGSALNVSARVLRTSLTRELDARVEAEVKRIFESEAEVPAERHGIPAASLPSSRCISLTHPEYEALVPRPETCNKVDLPENDLGQQQTQKKREGAVAIEPSFGLAVVYFSTKPDQPLWRRMAWLLAAFCLVIIQICCITSVHFDLTGPHCMSNEACREGYFCDRGPDDRIGRFLFSISPACVLSSECDLSQYGKENMCLECGAAVDVSNATDFCAAQPANLRCLPNGCYNPSKYGDTWDSTSFQSEAEQHIAQMQWSDKMSFFVACAVVGMEIGVESSDIFACDFLAQRGSPVVRFAIVFLGIIRRQVFVVWMGLVVPFVVVILGATSLEIILNVVALLFLLRIDDILYGSLFDEELREELEGSGALSMEVALVRKIQWNQFRYFVGYSLTVASTLYLMPLYGEEGAVPLMILGWAGFGILGVKPQANAGTGKYFVTIIIRFFLSYYVFLLGIRFWTAF